MYGTIRCIIGICCFAVTVLFAKYKKAINYKRVIMFGVISLMVTMLLNFVTFENLVYTFDSPEKAYNYFNADLKTEMLVQGKDSDLIVGKKDNKLSYLIVPKSEDGWKIGHGKDLKTASFRADGSADFSTIMLFQYKNENEYYIAVSTIKNNDFEITDSCNSKFVIFEPDENINMYYAAIDNYNSEYWIKINDEKYVIGELSFSRFSFSEKIIKATEN